MQDNIVFHNSWDDLHEEVDRSVLPEEYRGDLGKLEAITIRDCALQFTDHLRGLKKFVDDNEGKC